MIECMSADQLVYFIDLLGAIVQQVNDSVYVINAKEGPVYWEMINTDLWCVMDITST